MKMSVEKAKRFGGMIHLAWFRHLNQNEMNCVLDLLITLQLL